MIRIPLRPLATILKARKTGKNPDDIERANIRQRHEDMQDESRMRAEGRLLVLGMLFFLGFLSISARMAFWQHLRQANRKYILLAELSTLSAQTLSTAKAVFWRPIWKPRLCMRTRRS